jgi:hypothetical protein
MRGHSNGHSSSMDETLAMLALSGGSVFSPAFAFVDITLPPYAVDKSGVTDAGPAIQRAFNSLSGTGQAAWFPAGTYKIVTQVIIPSNLIVWQSPDATIVAALPGLTTTTGTAFYAPIPTVASATTLSATPVAGLDTFTLAVTSSVATGSYIEVVNAAHPFGAIYHVESGGLTVTLDRAMLYPFQSGDAVSVLTGAPVSNVTWYGNQGSMTGTCVGFIGGTFWHSVVQDLEFSNVTGAGADYLVGWLAGSYACVMRDLYADLTGASATFNAAWASEADTCGVERCGAVSPVGGIAYSAVKFADSRNCWANDCWSAGAKYGVALSTDAGVTSLGCEWCRVQGGSFLGCGQYGILISNGSANNAFTGSILATGAVGGVLLDGTGGGSMVSNTFERVDCSGTGGDGITVNAGAKGTRFDAAITDNPAAHCLMLHDECWIGYSHAFTTVAVNNDILLADGGALSTVTIESFDWDANVAGGGAFTVLIGAATRLNLSNGQLNLHTNSIGPDATGAGSVIATTNVKITGAAGSIGLYATAGTHRIGAAVDASGTATPLLVAGGFANRKQTVAATAGGFALAWPDAKSTDTMVFNGHQANMPTYTITPGTGFTVTDAGNLTWEYFVP